MPNARTHSARRQGALRVVLILALVCSFFYALPSPSGQTDEAYAVVRPDDIVAGQAIGVNHAEVPDSPDIEAQCAALGTRDNLTLWQRNAQFKTPMASTTKIMTALIALERSTPTTPMSVTYGAAKTEGSTANLKEGDTALLKDLLVGMLVPSGNDASVAIAENIAGTEFAFVELMNAKAADLGMVDTHYSNASGIIDVDNYTTASDYLLLTKAAMSNDLFREIVGAKEAKATISGTEVTFESTNLLLDQMEGANGVKTGFTDEAGYCLIASAEQNGFELYAVVLNSTTEDQRFEDAEALLEWGFAHYRTVELINATQPVATMALTSWINKTVPVAAAAPASANLFDYAGAIKQEVRLIDKEGSVNQGEEVGSIIWTQGTEVIAQVSLVSTQSVAGPDFWEGVSIWWQRFVGGFFDDEPHATSTTTLPETFELEINYLDNTDLAKAA